MDITEEMLDVIEELKGKRNPALWDPRCAQYLANKQSGGTKPAKATVKATDNS